LRGAIRWTGLLLALATGLRAQYNLVGPPVITSQPIGQSVDPGGYYYFAVDVPDGFNASYQWYLNGTAISGATSSSLVGYNVTQQSAGNYTVVVTDNLGSETSVPALLTVNPVALPVIVEQPLSVNVAPGEEVDLQVTTGSSQVAPTYQWYLNGVAISGANAPLYIISGASSTNAGSYTVALTNAAGTVTSSAATVTVGPAIAPQIAVQPASQQVMPGTGFSVSVNAKGSAPLNYQWYLNGTALPQQGVYPSAIYTVDGASPENAGSYTVTVSNSAGAVTSAAANVTVLPAVSPVITTQPVGGSCPVNADETTLFVNATGTTNLAYQWYLNGVAVPNATSDSLAFAPYSEADAGTYTVTVTDGQGLSVTSVPAVEVTGSDPTPIPAFSRQPAGQTVVAGAPFSLGVDVVCTYSGSNLVYQWMLNGAAVANGTQSFYSVPSASAADGGTYTCVCTSPGGPTTSAAANVVILPAVEATFLQQPVGADLSPGDELQLVAVATGTPSPAYQWYQGGLALSGATNRYYTVAAVTPASAGTYTVVATNSAGSVTSSPAVVSISAVVAPTIFSQPLSLQIDPNVTSDLLT
jgi:hypothetical protein